MKTRNIREVKKKFPKISKDTLEETFIQVVTQLGAVNMRVDRLEKSVQGLIYTNADERLMKIESALVLEGELKVGGVDDSEEVEFTKQELENLVSLVERTKHEIEEEALLHGMTSGKNVFTSMAKKLNKILKEK